MFSSLSFWQFRRFQRCWIFAMLLFDDPDRINITQTLRNHAVAASTMIRCFSTFELHWISVFRALFHRSSMLESDRKIVCSCVAVRWHKELLMNRCTPNVMTSACCACTYLNGFGPARYLFYDVAFKQKGLLIARAARWQASWRKLVASEATYGTALVHLERGTTYPTIKHRGLN